MFELPAATVFDRKIAKKTLCEQIDADAALRRVFTTQIGLTYWRHKLSPETINIAKGVRVGEIEIFEIELHVPEPDAAVLNAVDKAIPYPVLMVLRYEDRYRARISYKETKVNAAGSAARVTIREVFQTDWLEAAALRCRVEGLDLDSVYENFVRQIAGDALVENETESLKESIEKDKQRQKLQKKISALESKYRKEKQFNRQLEMRGEIRRLQKELETL